MDYSKVLKGIAQRKSVLLQHFLYFCMGAVLVGSPATGIGFLVMKSVFKLMKYELELWVVYFL